MKTSIIEVGGMLSALSAHGVEKQLAKLRGVKRAEMNYVSGSAMVVYDETVLDLETIKAKVHECGYHCSGELAPKHLCESGDPSSDVVAAMPPMGHAGHVHHVSHDIAVAAKHGEHADRKIAPQHAEHPGHDDSMAGEMGHGAGMDMNEMARDMRNRFWICLVFTLPIFVYSPMGLFTPPAPPFDLGLSVW